MVVLQLMPQLHHLSVLWFSLSRQFFLDNISG